MQVLCLSAVFAASAISGCGGSSNDEDVTPPDAVDRGMSVELRKVDDMLGHHLFEHVTVDHSRVIFTVSRSAYGSLGAHDRKRVIEAADLVATGEWRKDGTIPDDGLTIVVHDDAGRVLSTQHGVQWHGTVSGGQSI